MRPQWAVLGCYARREKRGREVVCLIKGKKRGMRPRQIESRQINQMGLECAFPQQGLTFCPITPSLTLLHLAKGLVAVTDDARN